MALKAKLEFYRFKLIPKGEEDFKTFRDYAIDELYQRRPNSDEQIMKKLFDHFMNGLVSDIAKSNRIKKQLKVIKTNENIHLDKKPEIDVSKNIIYGVISGGRFGRNGMMSDSAVDAEEAKAFGPDKTILRYYYFLLYLPLDHNEGCFIIHSNSKEETITDMFKEYISNLFKGNNYKKTEISMFCPSLFQEEFKNTAIIKSAEFKKTYLYEIYTEEGIVSHTQPFDVKIEIIPRNEGLSLSNKNSIKRLIKQLFFSRNEQYFDKLEEFDSKKIKLNSPFYNSDRTFNIDMDNLNLIPVVYLKDKIANYNDDETPDFKELNDYCKEIFHSIVLPEIRPDLI